ncbi:helix-turn-helix domain-containing protein [Acidipropionibacterium virtanenii]|uniref:Transcriptional regulator ClgR n=1 Tax=Acidipropionibacterium virtanenii TaxID=2057246 RepID=A0A344UUB4_9ACTN|nr:helix-turn-helix transcriptional regulator [Acidipropionibacterium virtanenii]AXE38862.1 Transcriptional regulator ClgR [Acidipropionibacterium virtanenii]
MTEHQTAPVPRASTGEPLWRDAVGGFLRRTRNRRGETLDDVATRAGVSPQYLSEIERGRKEPSSEVLAAVNGALDLTLLDLTVAVARTLHRETAHHDTLHRSTTRTMLALAA